MDGGIVKRRSNISINIGKISSAIEIGVDGATRQIVSDITSSGKTKLNPSDKTTLGYFVVNTIGLVEYFKFIFCMITFVGVSGVFDM